MSEVVTFVGGVVIVAAAAIVVGVVVWIVLEKARQIIDRHDEYVATRAASSIGQSLRGEAWWFSEHEPTRKLLARIADNLLTDRSALSDVSHTREEWRKDMAGRA